MLWAKAAKKYEGKTVYSVVSMYFFLLFFNFLYKAIWDKQKWTNKNSPYVITSSCKSSFWKTRICSQLFLNQITHLSKQTTSLDNLKPSNFSSFTIRKCFYRNALKVFLGVFFFIKFMKLFKQQSISIYSACSIGFGLYKPHIPLFSILNC